ncbi:MAG: alginate export family protein [Arenicellales bacterium]|nr:alginate export family protein [Arenicellales bacterium]
MTRSCALTRIIGLALVLVSWTIGTPQANAEDDEGATTLSETVSKGKINLSFRYRFEYVDQVGINDKAEASTLRTRLGLETAEYKDFKLLLEFSNVTVIGSERYNSTRNGKTEFPVVADPDGTEVNQAFLSYSPKDTSLALGRQRINLDNQRFIGGVGWRQNEQTYDSFTLRSLSLPDLRLFYGYIWEVKRIFGPDEGTPPEQFDSDSHALNVNFGRWAAANLSAYAYFLDLENAPANSNRTYGIRLTGKTEPASDWVVKYAAEFAKQSDYGDNPNDYTADYHLIELGAQRGPVFAKLGWEVLDGDQNQAGKQFRTPLATLHKFQGWADKFLNTPDAGVDDRYASLQVTFLGAKALLVYHSFEAASGGQKYGNEWDFSLTKTFAKKHNLLLKYADYKAKGFATDTTKWWLQYLLRF